MSSNVVMALVLALGLGALAQGTARAQAIFPHSYSINCSGTACLNPPNL